MGSQPNLYLLSVVRLQRLHEGNVQRLQFMSAMWEKANSVNPVILSAVNHLNIPRMKIVVMQWEIILDSFQKRRNIWTNASSSLSGPIQRYDKLLLNLVERYPGIQP